MNKLQNVEFHDSHGPEGPVEGFSFLIVIGLPNKSVRTKSERSWPREAYHETVKRSLDKKGREIPGKDILHFISYDADSKSYLLESAVRIGKGHQRQEAKMTVDEIKAEMPDGPESMPKIVEILATRLAYTSEGFPERPVYDKPKPGNRLIDPKDVLASCPRAACLSDEHREAVRRLVAADPIEKKDLPDGVLTLTGE
jgi:hypothetical protein